MGASKTLVASSLILLASAGFALADCRGIAGAGAQPDGAWLFRVNGSWRPIAELNSVVADGRSRQVNFLYVASEPGLRALRRGVLVIKTGLNGPGNVNVALAREAYTRIKEQCESYPTFNGGSVRGRSYDRYHDYGYNVEKTDQDLIQSFHVSYPARGGGCRRSHDATTDSYFAGRWQSNISQFSFDKGVVANGQYSQFVAQFSVSTAYAGTSMSDRRVEMKRYVADDSGLACVLFSSPVRPGTFIRINDIERRGGLFRTGEQSWEWPR